MTRVSARWSPSGGSATWVCSEATGRISAATGQDTVLKKGRPEELHFTTAIWGESEGVESRLRELMRTVRALRREMANDRDRRAFMGERRLPTPDPLPGSSAVGRRKRR